MTQRFRRLLAVGLVDSFGLALGWTVFSLALLAERGLGAVGVVNAAMLVGVALSAPVTAALSARWDGRPLLRRASLCESALRLATFGLFLAGAPLAVLAAAAALSHVLAWTGFAVTRAEVAAAVRVGSFGGAATMTTYLVGIAAVEALGAAGAALLPTPRGLVLLAVVVVYSSSVLPTAVLARAAVTRRAPRRRLAVPDGAAPFLLGGAGVMLLASGPTLLSVALAAQLHGRGAVAPAAVAFTVGSLLAPFGTARVARSSLSPGLVGTLWGVGMIAGWALAPLSLVGLLAAQLLSGLSMTALEGTMDARVAEDGPATATAGLAWTAAARALGGAAAAAGAPALIAASSLGALSGVVTVLLTGGLALSLTRRHRATPAPAARARVLVGARR